MLTTKLTAEKQSCGMCIANEVCLITNYTCSNTHRHHLLQSATHVIGLHCRGRLSVLYVFIMSNHFVSVKNCPVHLLKPNQWNSLFYILNSKLSQGSKHGAMVSTKYPTTQPSATSHKSETLRTSYPRSSWTIALQYSVKSDTCDL